MARIVALEADITQLRVDAIVNAANTSLAPGGGVCGAIHAAAGPDLARACREVAPCPTGEARITPGFRLPARWVIHAVGPVWRGGDAGEAEELASAYPLPLATEVAVSTVRQELARAELPARVVFCCFGPTVLDAYREAGVSTEGG